MSGGSSEVLEANTQISTGFSCDNCHMGIDRVKWKRCKKCNMFDLCHNCEKRKYENLPEEVRKSHQKFHEYRKLDLNEPITDACINPIGYKDAIEEKENDFGEMIESCLHEIWKNNKINNDYQMSYVMDHLKQLPPEVESSSESKEPARSQLLRLIGKYYTQGHETNINLLSLDGGGTRGHMTITVLCELINDIYIKPLTNAEPTKPFVEAQSEFTDKFHYIAGTSTGGLIAFCLAINHDLFDIKGIYEDAKDYFKQQGWTRYAIFFKDKYDPIYIHNKIDEIIGGITLNGKKLTAEDATLLDIHDLLNPDCRCTNDNFELYCQRHGNELEFVNYSSSGSHFKREKVLLITAYNTTKDSMMIFNTSYAEHWGYRIADVLKATMAAPTYFRPCTMYKRKKVNGHLERDGEDETFVDGGVFANDPELAALWSIRMQWKKPINYYIFSIGTGCYNAKLSVDNWKGGYWYWLKETNGLLVNMFMDGTHSLTETIMNNLAKFDNIKRMKFNYKLKISIELDDVDFAKMFNEEWKKLKTEVGYQELKDEYEVLVYFYNKFIKEPKKLLEQ